VYQLLEKIEFDELVGDDYTRLGHKKESWISRNFLGISNAVVIILPELFHYLLQDVGLGLVTVVNGIIVLFWYCTMVPFIVSPEQTASKRLMLILGVLLTILSVIYSGTNYSEDLHYYPFYK
jgi:hypothetical protein